MRMFTFARRCAKEILRDPINLAFGIGFPVVLLLLLSAMQANIPVPLFAIERLTPGITVFGLSFLSLFSATLVAKDRESAFLMRLYATPLAASDFILGYMLPLLPMALVQTAVCYLVAFCLGLTPTIGVLYTIVYIIPIAIFYISLGLLCGSLLGVKQVGGICGALLTNLSAWLAGIWFDLSLLGEVFVKVANLLPFAHAVELARGMLAEDFSSALPHLTPVLLYSIGATALAILCFVRQMKKQ